MGQLKETETTSRRLIDLRATAGLTGAKVVTASTTELNSRVGQPFIEDFNMEHSCSAVALALIAFSDSIEAGSKRSPFAQPPTQPSCVYLG